MIGIANAMAQTLLLLSLLHTTAAVSIAMLNGNHYPPHSDDATAEEFMNATLQLFKRDATLAKAAEAAMLITPEFALSSSTWLKACTSPKAPTPWCPLLPDDLSCGSPSSHYYRQLACLAKDINITLAVNLCEGDTNGTNWNTQAIFDATGHLLTKYRKTHPYKAKCFEKPARVTLVTFNVTGVPFETGIFTCKDILYSTPAKNLYDAGIRHFVYSSAIPLVGNAVKKVWSERYRDSFLMASDSANGDSGVYNNGDKLISSTLNNGSIVLWHVPV